MLNLIKKVEELGIENGSWYKTVRIKGGDDAYIKLSIPQIKASIRKVQFIYYGLKIDRTHLSSDKVILIDYTAFNHDKVMVRVSEWRNEFKLAFIYDLKEGKCT